MCSVVDESHSLGVYGASGEGLVAKLGLASKVHFRTASLSKAFCGRGGIVAVQHKIWNISVMNHDLLFSAPSFVHEIAAFEKTLEIIQQDHWRREKLMSNAYYLRNHLSQMVTT
jgi:CAI-1 autoinducer synthase